VRGKLDIMKKIRVGILFGGKSAEHEVSVRSARNIYDALDKEKFEPVLIGIDPSGKWLAADSAKLLDGPADATDRQIDIHEGPAVMLTPESKGRLDDTTSVDVVFPILHGPFGEDGTIQGLLKLADVPFVGPSVLGSAIGMDKDVAKRLLMQAGIRVAPFCTVRRNEGINEDEIIREFGLPLFVKPANLGSSIGVSKVHTKEDLTSAIESALAYDNKVLVESAVVGRECECAVLGNEDPLASVVGEVLPQSDFYTYAAKYLDEGGAVTEIPADLPEDVANIVQAVAVKVFKTLECEGMARIDVFVTPDNEVVVNEVNTIPGFTSISMYPKLWQASGISYADLITKLINLAMERYERDAKLKTSLH